MIFIREQHQTRAAQKLMELTTAFLKLAGKKSIDMDTTGTINPCAFHGRSYRKALEDTITSRLEKLVNQGCIAYGKTLLN